MAKAALGQGGQTVNLDALFRPVLSPEAEIFYPSWANWTDNVQQRWTDYLAPSYLGAIKVATVQDVQNIVGALHGTTDEANRLRLNLPRVTISPF